MVKKENFIVTFNKKLAKKVKANMSFLDLTEILKEDKIKFITKFDYEETLTRASELKVVLDKITSIVYKPHIKTDIKEIVLRSELSGKLDTPSFFETVRDSKLWKNKRGTMTPEYVHNYENIDTLLTYENSFISYLVDLLHFEIKELLVDVTPLVDSIEENFEISGISYGKHSILNEFKEFGYPYENVFNIQKGNANKIYSVLKSLNRKIKNIKTTEFYKTNKGKCLTKDILPTNILIHDELYSYCYRFYKANYQVRKDDLSLFDTYYYNYVIVNFINYLARINVGNTRLSKDSSLYIDESGRLRFKDFSFKKGIFSYLVKEDTNDHAFYLESHFINKAIRSDVKVEEDAIARYYVLTSYKYNAENEAILKKKIKSEEKVNNAIIFTHSNFLHNFNSVLTLSIYKDNHELLFKNLVLSLSLLFKANEEVYSSRCPVCGAEEIRFDGSTYRCENCNSSFSLINVNDDNLVWIKSFRR